MVMKTERIPLREGGFLDVPMQQLVDRLTRNDELIKALIQVCDSLRQEINFQLPPTARMSAQELKAALESGSYAPQEMVGGDNGIPLDTALTDQEFRVIGDTLTAAASAGGTLDGITVRFNMSTAPAIPLALFNPFAQPFTRIYVTTTAQAGKKLYLLVGREAASGSSPYTISAEFKNRVSDTLDSTVANLGDGATYTGSPVSVAEYGVILVSVYSNRNGTIYVDQTHNGTNYDIIESAAYVGGTTPGFLTYVYAPTARVRFTNAAGDATTTLRVSVRARRI